MKDNKYINYNYKLMRKKEEEEGKFMSNKIKINIPISFQVSQIFFLEVQKIKKIFTKKILSIGILLKMKYSSKI